tara:strand:+ start:68 stop:412 length:345 start_codon:yes stop_codon:yes gene_type:complete
MSEIKKYAVDHFSERMSAVRCLTVPEWGGSKIYYKPSMNFRDQGAVLRLHGDNKPADAVIMTLILKAMYENGKKIFVKSDMTEISLSYSPEVVSRIVTEMSDDEPVTVEDAVKN